MMVNTNKMFLVYGLMLNVMLLLDKNIVLEVMKGLVVNVTIFDHSIGSVLIVVMLSDRCRCGDLLRVVMDMRCCVVNCSLGLGLVVRVFMIYDWFMSNMDHGLLVLHSSLVVHHWLLSVYNLLMVDDWLFFDYSRHLRVMEHLLMNNRLLANDLSWNDMSWNDMGWNNMSWNNMSSWLFILIGHIGGNRLLVHVRLIIGVVMVDITMMNYFFDIAVNLVTMVELCVTVMIETSMNLLMVI